MLKATHKGKLKIGEKELDCYVLEDGTRILSSRQAIESLTRGKAKDVPSIVSSKRLKPFLSQGLNVPYDSLLIEFDAGQAGIAHGVKAELFVDICDAYVEAWENGALAKHQVEVAQRSNSFLRASSKVGIIALIDEATGYQKIRSKAELQTTLDKWIAESKQEWAPAFPNSIFAQFARLMGYTEWVPGKNPKIFSRYVNEFIYGLLDENLPSTLKEINPNPHFGNNHHQFLTKEARLRLRSHLFRVEGILMTCKTIPEARAKCEEIFNRKIVFSPRVQSIEKKYPHQRRLFSADTP